MPHLYPVPTYPSGSKKLVAFSSPVTTDTFCSESGENWLIASESTDIAGELKNRNAVTNAENAIPVKDIFFLIFLLSFKILFMLLIL